MKRALISVFDKENILEIAEFLPCKTPLPTPPQD